MFQVGSDTQDRARGNGKRTSSASSNLPGNLLGRVVEVWHGHEMSWGRVIAGLPPSPYPGLAQGAASIALNMMLRAQHSLFQI